jgi:hypothetical protein
MHHFPGIEPNTIAVVSVELIIAPFRPPEIEADALIDYFA